jgi:hypothetical protein
VGQGLDIGFPKFKYVEFDMGCQLDPVVKIGFVSMSGGRKRLDSRVVGLGNDVQVGSRLLGLQWSGGGSRWVRWSEARAGPQERVTWSLYI